MDSLTQRDSRASGTPWLAASVHWHAFLGSPADYLAAIWWRLRGKKLRSRNRMTVVLGKSPRAYALWIARHEHPQKDVAGKPGDDAIIALVEAGPDAALPAGLSEDLAREGITPILLEPGSAAIPAAVVGSIDWTAGPWFMPLERADRLAIGAGDAYRAAILGAPAGTRIIYADDDLLDPDGTRHSPHFKPGWNADLHASLDYLSGSCIVRLGAEELAGCAAVPGWQADLTGRYTQPGAPRHVAKVLHHRRDRPPFKVPARPASASSELPSVSIIVPTRNRVELLNTCLAGVRATDYPGIELIVVDNDSDEPATLACLDRIEREGCRVLRHPGVFNYAAITNRAAREARGRLLCLLNNDIEMIAPDWLRLLAAQALRDDVGAVGAQLLYPDGRIQHAGVVIGVGGAAGHAHRLLHPDERGYFRRHALPQFVTAVTAACMVVARDRYFSAGGMDEQRFPVAFNDVDLCLELNARGWQSFYEPRARLVHHESLSRGLDVDPAGSARFAGELAEFRAKWSSQEAIDPFHHPHLSRLTEQFVLGL